MNVEPRKYYIETVDMSDEEIEEYVQGILKKFKKTPYPKNINYRFNILNNEDIYISSRDDGKPFNIDTCPPDFKILGSDTEIYIPDRGR
jgi:hypothetical protein